MFNNITCELTDCIFTTMFGSEAIFRSGKPSNMHTLIQSLNPSTSANPFMTKLQNLFVALVNMDVFQMILKFSLYIHYCLTNVMSVDTL